MSPYPQGEQMLLGACSNLRIVQVCSLTWLLGGDTKGTVWREAIAAWEKLGPHPYPLPLAFLAAH